MRIPFFDVTIPKDRAHVDSVYRGQSTDRAVACVVQMRHEPVVAERVKRASFGKLWFASYEENVAAVMRSFLKGGVQLICTDGGQGDCGEMLRQGIGAPLLHQSLMIDDVTRALDRGANVIGVDDIGKEHEMWSRESEAAETWPGKERLFVTVDAAVDRLIRSQDSSPFGRFARLFWRGVIRDERFIDVCASLLSLERRLKSEFRTNVRRSLLFASGEDRLDGSKIEMELEELKLRIARRAEARILDENMWTSFRRDSRRSSEEDEDAGERVQLRHRRMEALEYASNILKGQIPMSFEEMQMSGHNDEVRLRELDSFAGHVSQTADTLGRILEVARYLGINPTDYPSLCRTADRYRVVRPIVTAGFTRSLLLAINQACGVIERVCCQSQQQKDLITTLRRYGLLRKLQLITLTPEDHASFMDDLDGCRMSSVIDGLLAEDADLPDWIDDEGIKVDERRNFLLDYYDLAKQRGAKIAIGTQEEMERRNVDRAVLVCLGFHVPEVLETWKGAGLSHASVGCDTRTTAQSNP